MAANNHPPSRPRLQRSGVKHVHASLFAAIFVLVPLAQAATLAPVPPANRTGLATMTAESKPAATVAAAAAIKNTAAPGSGPHVTAPAYELDFRQSNSKLHSVDRDGSPPMSVKRISTRIGSKNRLAEVRR